MSKDRERRLKATGKWFQPTKKKKLWTNNIFPAILIIGFIVYIINL